MLFYPVSAAQAKKQLVRMLIAKLPMARKERVESKTQPLSDGSTPTV